MEINIDGAAVAQTFIPQALGWLGRIAVVTAMKPNYSEAARIEDLIETQRKELIQRRQQTREDLEQIRRVRESRPAPQKVVEPIAYKVSGEVKHAAEKASERPGCSAAEGLMVAQGMLDGLGRNFGGWGVMRNAKEWAEGGAEGAERMGDLELASEMREVAAQMPGVHDPETAQQLADRLDGLKERAWNLAKRCRGPAPAQLVEVAKGLAQEISEGKITRDEAIARIQEIDAAA